MKGYWLILKAEITNQAAQDEYSRLWAPIAAKYQARINTTSTPPHVLEARGNVRVLLVEFPSYEAAKACYEDPAYQAALAFASAASQRDLVLFEGDLK